MTISEKTRLARVDRWQGMKAAWKSKLGKAENQNDTDVANKMIAEADMMLSKLETKDEVVPEENIGVTTGSKSSPKKRITKTDTVSHKAKDSEDNSTIGL
jgi:hypothetical protein